MRGRNQEFLESESPFPPTENHTPTVAPRGGDAMFLATSWPPSAWPPLSAGIVQAREDRKCHLGTGS